MISLIVFLFLLVASMAICGVSAFKLQRDKLLVFVSLKASAVLSILIFGLTCANLASNMYGTTIFILLSIAFQIISAIVSILPTKNDIFSPLYSCLDLLSSASLAVAGLLLVPLSPFGLPIGFAVGLLAVVIIALAKHSFNWKIDIAKYGFFVFATSLLGQVPVILMSGFSIINIVFSVGALIFFGYSILKSFFSTENSRFIIARNIMYYLSLISLASSIFLSIY